MNLFRTIFCLFLMTILAAGTAHAQLLNVERMRDTTDQTGWHGELGFDLSADRYKERVLKLENAANASYNSEKHTYMVLSSLELITVDGSSQISTGYIHVRSTFLRKKTVSPELFAQYQYNENLGLLNRMLGGSGVRFEIFSTERVSGNIQTGLMYEYEEWELPEEETVENTLLKSTSNISLVGDLNSQTSILVTGYYQARPDRFFKPRAILESQLAVSINKYIRLAVSFTMQHDAEPVRDVPKLTYELKNGLLISF